MSAILWFLGVDGNKVRLGCARSPITRQLHGRWVMPKAAQRWSLTSLREKDKVRRDRCVMFQMAEGCDICADVGGEAWMLLARAASTPV
jgi:hypothetical protein